MEEISQAQTEDFEIRPGMMVEALTLNNQLGGYDSGIHRPGAAPRPL